MAGERLRRERFDVDKWLGEIAIGVATGAVNGWLGGFLMGVPAIGAAVGAIGGGFAGAIRYPYVYLLNLDLGRDHREEEN